MLRIEDLSVSYGSVKALDTVNLAVSQKGVLHGVIGPNGAGKSTLMDAITGRCKPTQGRVLMNGIDITSRPIEWRRRMGMSRSFQRTSIFPGITVGQQLEMVATQLGEKNLHSILDTLELNEIYDLMADSIAYGDQRRVDIALALVGQPSLMLLDEPAAGLSTAETVKLFEHLLAVVRQRNVTALDLGRLLTTGTPAEVRVHPDVISAYLGSSA